MDLWHILHNNWKNNNSDVIEWKNTPGMGDTMYALNTAYMRSFLSQRHTTLNLHMFHSNDYYYHYEDPETVLQRAKYIADRYMWKDMVTVNFIPDSTNYNIYVERYQGVKRERRSDMYRFWSFNKWYEITSTKDKIVLWRPTGNLRQQLNGIKTPLLDHEWKRLIDRLTDFGFNVVEIDYRTPISEVFYHIRTCECCISYEGMWHYITKNMFKPHIVLSAAKITQWHTPNCVRIDPKNFLIDNNLKDIYTAIDQATEQANAWQFLFNRLVNGY